MKFRIKATLYQGANELVEFVDDEIPEKDLELLMAYYRKDTIPDAWREMVDDLRFEVLEQIDKARGMRMLERMGVK